MKVGNTHFVENHFVEKHTVDKKISGGWSTVDHFVKITLLNVPIAIVTVVSKPHGIRGAQKVLLSEGWLGVMLARLR